jgi:hypothetical protein
LYVLFLLLFQVLHFDTVLLGKVLHMLLAGTHTAAAAAAATAATAATAAAAAAPAPAATAATAALIMLLAADAVKMNRLRLRSGTCLRLRLCFALCVTFASCGRCLASFFGPRHCLPLCPSCSRLEV